MTINQLIAIFTARWKLFAAIVAVTLVGAIIVTLLLPKQYTASASVVIDLKGPDPVAGMIMPGMLAPSYMATQVDIAQSERVVRKVISTLRLAENADAVASWREATEGKGTVQDWLTGLLLEKLQVEPSRESNVLRLSYAATDPRFATVITNAFVQAYIQTVLELRTEPAEHFNEMFEAQANQARARLTRAQEVLADYQQKHGIVSIDERMDIENARLVDLSAQVVAIQATAAEARYRANQADAFPDRSPEAVSNPLVSGLRADRARQEAKLQELQSRLGDGHPQVVEIKASIAELERRIGTETSRVAQSIGANSSINRAREAQLREALDKQRQKVLEIKSRRNEMDALVREVEVAQRAIEGLQARLAQTDLERQATRTNVSILKSASEPVEPSSPKKFLNMFLALIVGTGIGLVTIFGLEFLNRRLRTDDDITTIGLPILGNVPDSGTGKRADSTDRLLSFATRPFLTSTTS